MIKNFNLFKLKDNNSLLVFCSKDVKEAFPLIESCTGTYEIYIDVSKVAQGSKLYSLLKNFIETNIAKALSALSVICFSNAYPGSLSNVVESRIALSGSEYFSIEELIKEFPSFDFTSLIVKNCSLPPIRDWSSYNSSADTYLLELNSKSLGNKKLEAKYESLLNTIKYTKTTKACFLVGPAGSGKSTLAALIARDLGAPYISLQMDAGTTSDVILGGPSINTANNNILGNVIQKEGSPYAFVLGVLSLAIKNGWIITFDEINYSMFLVLSIFNQCFDDKPIITLPNGEVIEKHPNFFAFFTMNAYSNTTDINASLKNRAIVITVPSLDESSFVNRCISFNKALHKIHLLSKEFYKTLYNLQKLCINLCSILGENYEYSPRNCSYFQDLILVKPLDKEAFINAFKWSYLNCLSMGNRDNTEEIESAFKSKDFQLLFERLYSLYDFKLEHQVSFSSLESFEQLLKASSVNSNSSSIKDACTETSSLDISDELVDNLLKEVL